jgi:hypothetical protein
MERRGQGMIRGRMRGQVRGAFERASERASERKVDRKKGTKEGRVRKNNTTPPKDKHPDTMVVWCNINTVCECSLPKAD